MEVIEQDSSWNDPPTPEQIRAITRLCWALGIRELLEEGPSNRLEARNLLYWLRAQLKAKNKRR